MELDVPETDVYIIVVNYHNPTKGKHQMITVKTSDQQTGTLHLHECQYRWGTPFTDLWIRCMYSNLIIKHEQRWWFFLGGG